MAIRPFGALRNKRQQFLKIASLSLGIVLALGSVTADAKRTILGQVKDESGKPVRGLLVKAWDDDSSSDNDFMGQSYTDANGKYRIVYRGGHWDPYPHRITKWRPDIFVKVLVNADGYWIKTAKSRVYSDHKLKNDLTINLTVAKNETRTRFTRFKPMYHAMPFINQSRVVCAAPTCQDEHAGKMALAAAVVDPSGITSATIKLLQKFSKFDWALCGGLSLSALQDYRAGRKPKEFSPAMKERLVKNQLKTLSPTVWLKFVEWQAKPTLPHTLSPHTIGSSTKGEWPKVKQAIDAGAPIILGLIRNQNAHGGGVSKNHQVLAAGYSYNRLTTKVTIYTYDPNYCPSAMGSTCDSSTKFSELTFYTGIPQNQIKASFKDPDGKPASSSTRGFFVIREGSGRPHGNIYQPEVTVAANNSMATAMPSNAVRVSRVFRTRGVEGEEAVITLDDSEPSEDAIQSFEEALAEWASDADETAALERLQEIETIRERQVSTRSLERDEAEEEVIQRLISPDQFMAPLPME
jgi:hypothetical protein